jgi:hypothetical protein
MLPSFPNNFAHLFGGKSDPFFIVVLPVVPSKHYEMHIYNKNLAIQMELNRMAQASAEIFKRTQEATRKLQTHSLLVRSIGSVAEKHDL